MTGLDYVVAALEILGVYTPGETLSDADANSVLNQGNRMLDSWSADLEAVYAETQEDFTLTSSDESYTIGPTGDFVTVRPLSVLRAYTRDTDGSDHKMSIVSNREYQDIILKESGDSIPRVMSYNPTNPNGTILFYPPPDLGYEFRITSLKPLASMTLAGSYVVPPGYDDTIVWNMAVLNAPKFGKAGMIGSALDKTSIAGIANHKYKALLISNLSTTTPEVDPAMPYSNGVIRSWQSDD